MDRTPLSIMIHRSYASFSVEAPFQIMVLLARTYLSAGLYPCHCHHVVVHPHYPTHHHLSPHSQFSNLQSCVFCYSCYSYLATSSISHLHHLLPIAHPLQCRNQVVLSTL